MERRQVKLSQIGVNRENPRKISEGQMRKLIRSILVFPKMMEVRPIAVDETMTALGGNMRYRALVAITELSEDELRERMEEDKGFVKLTSAEQEALVERWVEWQDDPTAQVAITDFTEEQKREFIIKDNTSFGEWDWEELSNNWDTSLLDDWGLDLFENEEGGGEAPMTETERLSELEFTGMYYEPEEVPRLTLGECVDLEKFNAKVAVIEESKLTKAEKEMMKMFAYRFIKINFEMVANYYAFNASEEEKEVMERLRLVLVDGSIDGHKGNTKGG